MTETKKPQKHVRPVPPEQFQQDLRSLSPGELRKKYAPEANSHKNMKSGRAKKGYEYVPEWEEFPEFLRAVGPKPTISHTLDRTDAKDPMYGPDKVRWADKRTQTVNRTNTRTLSYRGRTMTLKEFSDDIGATYNTVWDALERGDTPEQIAARVTYREMRKARGESTNPWSHPDPVIDRKIRADFAAWKSKLKPSCKQYGEIDIYHFLKCREAYNRASKEWGRVVAEDGEDTDFMAEIERAMELATQQGKYAMSRIETRDPEMAKSLQDMSLDAHVNTYLYAITANDPAKNWLHKNC